MGRMLAIILGAAVILGVAYYYVTYAEHQAQTEQGPSAPKQTLDNVHRAADRIEAEGQKRAEEAAKPVQGENQ